MNYRFSFALLLLLQILFFSQVIFRGEVIFPHDNDREVGVQEQTRGNTRISNRKFSDQSSQFVPELNTHLNGNNYKWASTWNPAVEFGRPTFHLGGLSRAHIITNAISLFTSNPHVLYTAVVVITIFLTGIFFFLFLKALELHPIACFSAAAGLSLGVSTTYWLTFLTFTSTSCWTACLLWLITLFIRKSSPAVALGIAFASYSLLTMAYPQAIILAAYLICAYTALSLWQMEGAYKKKVLKAAALLGAAVFGLFMAAPEYVDLALTASRSARFATNDKFFLAVLPTFTGVADIAVFLYSIFDAFWQGNPISPEYPAFFNGLSLTPFYFSLCMLTLVNGRWRSLWLWQSFAFICLIATIWKPAYLFAVHYLGFSLSPIQFLGSAFIPFFVMSGFLMDSVLRHRSKRAPFKNLIVFLPVLFVGALILSYLKDTSLYLNISFIILSCVIVTGVYLFSITRRKSYILLILTVISTFAYSYNIKLTKPLENIHISSEIVDFIKSETKDGSRYAFVGNKDILPPNQEILLGIKSIHSYDSLSSVNYQNLVSMLSKDGAKVYGRHFNTITDDTRLEDPMFSYTGISLFISKYDFAKPGLRKIKEIEGYKFYKTVTPAVLVSQIANFTVNNDGVVLGGFIEEHTHLPVEPQLAFDDLQSFSVTPYNGKTLLFLSQQYHPGWSARSKSDFLETIMINDFYQGVVVPPNTKEITLEFRSYSIWMWVPQVLFILLYLVLFALWSLRKYARTNKT